MDAPRRHPVFRSARPWQGRTVLVTGASAGVGRAVALRFVQGGAAVGLLARDDEALRALVQEIERAGGRALALPADVADAQAVEAAASRCEAELGPIAVWVNNAMATVYAPVAELEADEVRRVTEVTYLGYVHGTLAALRRMRTRNAGVVVQVGSALAYRAIPLQAAYCGAKHAIRGFTDSVRSELLAERSRVRITAVHLPAIDTPQFDWARSRRPDAPRPVAPVYAPEVAARAVERAALRGCRELWVGRATPLLVLANALAPAWLDRYLVRSIEGQASGEPLPGGREGNLYQPAAAGHRLRGRFGDEAKPDAFVVSEGVARVAATAVLVLAAGAAGAWLATRGRR